MESRTQTRIVGNVDADTPWDRLAALHRTLPAAAVFACTTAAWMHGLGVGQRDAAEVMLPPHSSARTSGKVVVRRSRLEASDTTQIRHLPATGLHRTLRDLSLFSTEINALIAFDAALCKGRTTKAKLLADPFALPGRRGAARFRRLAKLAAPAESPMESRLRYLLVSAGLPMPDVQVDLHSNGRFLGRADLYYPQAKLVIEFDGGNHRDRLVSDDQRQNLIISAGYRILRFTSTDVYTRPDVVVAQVRGSLATPR